MSTLFNWDSTNVNWAIPGTPVIYKDDQYHKSSGFKYIPAANKYVKIWGNNLPIPSFGSVPFETASWTDIRTVLNRHYLGLTNVDKFWNIGDERNFVIPEIISANGDEIQPSQTVRMRIVDMNKDDLSVPNNFRTKAAVTLVATDVLDERGKLDISGTISTIPWVNWSRRTWCNTDLYNKMTEKANIKTVIKKTGNATTHDSIWIPSINEINGTGAYAYYLNNSETGKKLASDTSEVHQITSDNIETFFTKVDGASYQFVYDEENSVWRSNNQNVSSSTASITLTALSNMYVEAKITAFSENWCDKGILKKNNVTMIDNVSGNGTIKTNSFLVNEGDILTIYYSKDGSVNYYGDTCSFELKVTSPMETYVTRTITNNSNGVHFVLGNGYYNSNKFNTEKTSNLSNLLIGFCL